MKYSITFELLRSVVGYITVISILTWAIFSKNERKSEKCNYLLKNIIWTKRWVQEFKASLLLHCPIFLKNRTTEQN